MAPFVLPNSQWKYQGVQVKQKERIRRLIAELGVGLYEREEILAKCLLAAIGGQSVFLFGPPGTAKSLVARRVSQAFSRAGYFECLLNRFTTPEELFGPVSLKGLKEDKYERKTASYLPDAQLAFLDEIWKAGPSILNSLLTIINERKFHNGGASKAVPLKGIIAASNETPPQGQGLEALYDRFILRLAVMPLMDKDHFMDLVDGPPLSAEVKLSEGLAVDDSEWNAIIGSIGKVKFSNEVREIVHAIRKRIDEYNAGVRNSTGGNDKSGKTAPLYVSDRRWQKAAHILKTAAVLCDRMEVLPVDVMILRDCLWNEESQREDVAKIVEEATVEFCPYRNQAFESWEEKLEGMTDAINETLFYSADEYLYDTTINGEECFSVDCMVESTRSDPYYYHKLIEGQDKKRYTVHIPLSKIGTNGDFTPLCDNDEVKGVVRCNFKGTETCHIRSVGSGKKVLPLIAVPPVRGQKGTYKKGQMRAAQMFSNQIVQLAKELETIRTECRARYDEMHDYNSTPFVSQECVAKLESAYANFFTEIDAAEEEMKQQKDKVNQYVDR